MASSPDHISMALFCDFENVALGVRDANYEKFDIKRVLERLLLKGSIVVKKAYCDWERYKGFKAAMHEANFELIEIPHVRQSGKNSADIRLVVDALDLCYTKSHVNTFVIISGDSDFSPLVSKLRENAKYVIGVGVKQSTSDLLIANCDEFIFYDDLVRESQRQAARRDTRDNREPQQARRTPEEEARRREELDARRTKAVEMAAETYEALVTDRDEGGRIWASVLKEAIKRRNPGFNENYYGFRTFGNLLEEARARGLLEFGRDEKSSAFVYRSSGGAVARTDEAPHGEANGEADGPQAEGRPQGGANGSRGRDRDRGRGRDRDRQPASAQAEHAQAEHSDAGLHEAEPAQDRHPTERFDDAPEGDDSQATRDGLDATAHRDDEAREPAPDRGTERSDAPREERGDGRRRGRGGRSASGRSRDGRDSREPREPRDTRDGRDRQAESRQGERAPTAPPPVAVSAPVAAPATAAPVAVAPASASASADGAPPAKTTKAPRAAAKKTTARKTASKTAKTDAGQTDANAAPGTPAPVADAPKAAPRARRPRKAADDAA